MTFRNFLCELLFKMLFNVRQIVRNVLVLMLFVQILIFLVRMYLQANKSKILRNVYVHTRMYLWLKRILSLVLLILYSMRFIWNKILFYIHIAPLSRSYLPCKWNSFPITSPILLVAKRKSNGSHVDQSKEAHLTSYRFCFDFRYLNSQTLNFSYNIPDVQ